MKTLIQILVLFFAPILVYEAVQRRVWWGLVAVIAFIFTYFWSRHAAIKKEDRFIRQFLFSLMVTGAVSLMIWYFLN
ncbi:MAG: hypothetical protein ACLFSQ_01770 [Candidatus Zixiibacteriota bacterium]